MRLKMLHQQWFLDEVWQPCDPCALNEAILMQSAEIWFGKNISVAMREFSYLAVYSTIVVLKVSREKVFFFSPLRLMFTKRVRIWEKILFEIAFVTYPLWMIPWVVLSIHDIVDLRPIFLVKRQHDSVGYGQYCTSTTPFRADTLA